VPSLTRRTPLARLALRGGLAKARTPGRTCGLRPYFSPRHMPKLHPRHARFSPSGYCLSWEAGRVVRATLFYFKARPPRPADAFAPDGWAGLVPPDPPRLLRDEREGPSDLTGQTFTEARTCGGSVPTKPRYRLRDRPGHRHPPRHPGPEPGSREGDGGIIGYGAWRGINFREEKCRSERNQGVGGRRVRVLSTGGGPLSGVFQALARGQARSQAQENAFSPARGRDRRAASPVPQIAEVRVWRGRPRRPYLPLGGGESNFNVLAEG